MSYNPVDDAQILKEAMKGIGTDETTIINMSVARPLKVRLEIKQAFKKLYGKDLLDAFRGELSGHLLEAILALYTDPIEYDCEQLRKAKKFIGWDDDTLLEILVTRPPEVRRQFISQYSVSLKKDLLKDIESGTKGNLRAILMSILKGERSEEENPDIEKCEEWVKCLMNEEEKKWDKDNSFFWKMLVERSPAEVLRIGRLYRKYKGKTIIDVIEKHFGKTNKHVAIYYLCAMLNPSEFFAKRIYKSIKGLGTKDNQLIRVLVTRNEKDMFIIKAFYQKLYNVDMLKGVKGDTSGDYQKLMLELSSKNTY